ncbi:carboxylesterase, type B [Aspergillus violaceofuscus CBS 115571]|uniref:Carboxylic ester hydrolase n=1 Tax=Aspergillus violaceofuscus (strain CBS 115571) TaxID=1450538 RepID=A0A2V5GU77_ASPV1|nr:carboxylesterase, type B [Aspergillus violaceofuscus CBS 115571]
MRALLVASLAGIVACSSASPDPLTISTTSGIVHGGVNSSMPDVKQFLGIPFAQPPVDSLRWLPPQRLDTPDSVINGTEYPPSCIQITTWDDTSVFSVIPETLILNGVSEDCLTLSVWAPKTADAGSKLPVLIWIYGGSFVAGGTDTPAWHAGQWVQRSQEHIVVSIQYRLNIFGWPGAEGLEDQNLGFLDQRAGIEWVQENIAAFGGDPDNMVLWGQSAGGGSVDVQNFAYPDDPIVNGFISDSGSVFLTVETRSEGYTNFSSVARHFNCTAGSAAATLDCMRQVPAAAIESVLEVESSLTFYPWIDDKVVFNNYTERYVQGRVSNKPAIFGSNANEGASLITLPEPATAAPDEATVAAITQRFQCAAPYSTQLRGRLGLQTYNYQYRGNFSNVSPLWWMGAYHCSELPLLFGTSGDFRGADTPFETEVSRRMQQLWLAFVKSPACGLAAHGWQDASSGLVQVFANGTAVTDAPVAADLVYADCAGYYSNYLA